MSDSLRQGNDSKAAVLILGAGLVSGILYSSAIFSLAFLIPVQVAFGRRGFWTGLAAAGAALVASVAGELVPILISGGLSALSGGELGLGSAQFLLLAILPPAVLLAALILMNLPFWTGRAGFARGFAGTALASLVAIPGLYALSRDGGFLPYFEERLKAYIEPVLAQAGSGVDASALRAAFDVKVIAQTSVTILYCSFAALLLLWLAGSRWLGNRLSGTGSLGRQEAKSLSDFRLPYLLVWPFLVAWTGVLA